MAGKMCLSPDTYVNLIAAVITLAGAIITLFAALLTHNDALPQKNSLAVDV
jgi:hypothetical protein